MYASGALALLLLGLYWERSSNVGAYFALLSGLFAVLGLKPVQRQLELADRLGFEPTGAQIGLLTLLLSVGTMVLGSFLFPNASAKWKES